MQRELRDQWCAALRSGEYIGGRSRLRALNNDGISCYCPIGVLCNIIDPVGWTGPEITAVNSMPFFGWREALTQTTPLPKEILATETQATISCLFDNTGMSLSDMADWIEVNV